MASTIWVVCVRDEPWSGKSDASSTSGSPSPSYSTAVHELDGSASTPAPPLDASVVDPLSPLLSSSSPPQPAAANASTATSRARRLNEPRFLKITSSLLLHDLMDLTRRGSATCTQPLLRANG